jgi:8-oxo-dGTP pyrophosphatase MutT (NUDIX family)
VPLEHSPISSIPHKRLASVLVLLHLSTNPKTREEELKVTLTTRSKRMRSHPGETALPGGKFEDGTDKTIEETAVSLLSSPLTRSSHV